MNTVQQGIVSFVSKVFLTHCKYEMISEALSGVSQIPQLAEPLWESQGTLEKVSSLRNLHDETHKFLLEL